MLAVRFYVLASFRLWVGRGWEVGPRAPLGYVDARRGRRPDSDDAALIRVTRRDWERLSRGWRRELDERIATLQAVRNRLTGCIGCGCLSLQRCALINSDDEAALLGPGAHYLSRPSPLER